MDKLKKFLLCSFIILTSFYQALSQEIKLKDLFGEWKVIDYTLLMYITAVGRGNMDEGFVRMIEEKRYLKFIVNIDSNGISTNAQELPFSSFTCDLIHPKYVVVNVVKNNDTLGYSSSDDIEIDSNHASIGFVKLLDKKYSKKTLTILDSSCKDDYGNETLKICIVNTDKIGLFREGNDLTVLERKKKK